jgi:hypothetical protein
MNNITLYINNKQAVQTNCTIYLSLYSQHYTGVRCSLMPDSQIGFNQLFRYWYSSGCK